MDIARNCDIALQAIHTLEQAGQDVIIEKLPAFAITKKEILAMRFPSINDEVSHWQHPQGLGNLPLTDLLGSSCANPIDEPDRLPQHSPIA